MTRTTELHPSVNYKPYKGCVKALLKEKEGRQHKFLDMYSKRLLVFDDGTLFRLKKKNPMQCVAIKPTLNKTYRRYVYQLGADGSISCHILIANTFLSNPNNYPRACFIDRENYHDFSVNNVSFGDEYRNPVPTRYAILKKLYEEVEEAELLESIRLACSNTLDGSNYDVALISLQVEVLRQRRQLGSISQVINRGY